MASPTVTTLTAAILAMVATAYPHLASTPVTVVTDSLTKNLPMADTVSLIRNLLMVDTVISTRNLPTVDTDSSTRSLLTAATVSQTRSLPMDTVISTRNLLMADMVFPTRNLLTVDTISSIRNPLMAATVSLTRNPPSMDTVSLIRNQATVDTAVPPSPGSLDPAGSVAPPGTVVPLSLVAPVDSVDPASALAALARSVDLVSVASEVAVDTAATSPRTAAPLTADGEQVVVRHARLEALRMKYGYDDIMLFVCKFRSFCQVINNLRLTTKNQNTKILRIFFQLTFSNL